jgi:hypothetical protein
MAAFTALQDSLSAWPGVHLANFIFATPMEELAEKEEAEELRRIP